MDLYKNYTKRLLHSVWLFPAICLVVLVALTIFKINGSSVGIYNQAVYTKASDKDLLQNVPREIRSDEWLWTTQMTIAQANNGFKRINQNIGNGQDMSLINEVPYAEWSTVFKPQNLVFFILPLEYAFALKWWLMGFLLLMACYFFILSLLPEKRGIAAILSLSLLMSPFVQWWYQYITLGPMYYSLFMATVLVLLFQSSTRRSRLLLCLLLSYLTVCFVLVLYPPFQIACAIAMAAFGTGFLLQQHKLLPSRKFWHKLGYVAASALLAGFILTIFFYSRQDAVQALENTAYPGRRLVHSGGYNAAHIFSGHLGFQFQFPNLSSHYKVPSNDLTNPSESSNFLLLLPFLLLPSAYIIWQDRRRHRATDWPLVTVNIGFLLLVAWLLIPHLFFLGWITLLNKVPANRLLISLGLLNIMQLVLVMKRLSSTKERFFTLKLRAAYVFIIFIIELWLGFYIMKTQPGFIGLLSVILFAIPIPVTVFLILSKKYLSASIVIASFILLMAAFVNPLYRGLKVLTDTPISVAIRQLSADDRRPWATDVEVFQNFPAMNNAPSISGTYSYPQLDIWQAADPTGVSKDIYNRYARVTYKFDRDPNKTIDPGFLELDHVNFYVLTEPCGSLVRSQNVGYILTDEQFGANQASCLRLVRSVSYPNKSYYIYRLNY